MAAQILSKLDCSDIEDVAILESGESQLRMLKLVTEWPDST